MKKTLLSTAIAALLPMGGASAMTAGAYTSGSYKPQRQAASLDLAALNRLGSIEPASTEFQTKLDNVNADRLELTVLNSISELVVIDEGVRDKHLFYKNLKPGQDVVEISAKDSGVQQLTQALMQHKDLNALHIISHAKSGEIQLGNQWLDKAQLEMQLSLFDGLKTSLKADADILFYGCELAKGQVGEDFLEIIQSHTGLDVAASDDLTGHASLDGDWDLEIQKGDIEAKPVSKEAMANFVSVLAPTETTAGTIYTAVGPGGTGQYFQVSNITTPDGNFLISNSVGDVVSIYGTVSGGGSGGRILAYNTGTGSNVGQGITVAADAVDAGTFQLHALKLCNTAPALSGSFSTNLTITGNHAGGSTSTNVTVTTLDCLNSSNQAAEQSVDVSTTFGTNLELSSFTISYNGAAPGDRFFTLAAYTTGNVQPPGMPEMNVQGNSATITDGDASPAVSDNTDFGTPLVGAANIVRTFTIQNTGTSGLSLSGSPAVAISGSTDFTISTQPASSTVASSSSTTFQVTLDPTTAGVQTANISIDNNDADENPYNFSIRSNNGTLNTDGSLTAAAGVSEPVNLPTIVTSAGATVNVFDFTLSDGGGGDGQPMGVSQIVLNVSGTSTDAERGKVTWRLNGPDATNVTGTYSAAADTVTFGSLSISVPDGGNEVYTVNAFYNDNTSITDNATFILSVDGDTDVTTTAGGTSMGTTTAVTNSGAAAFEVVATSLAFTTQPAGSVSGAALTTQPVVTARDAAGNTDVDFTETITLTEASAGSITGESVATSSGVATFTAVTYTATLDQQSFTLTANDQDGVGSNLPTVNANAVTSDVVATKLIFSTQPAPLTVTDGMATSFTTVPVVNAVDAGNAVDTDYTTAVTLSEVAGAGTATMTGTGDTDADAATVTLNMTAGAATFTGLSATYNLSGAPAAETFNIRATSGGLTLADSNQLTATFAIPTITSSTYDASTGSLVVTGTNFAENAGAANDVTVTNLTLTGEGGATYTLTSATNIERDSATQFTVPLSGADKLHVDGLLNENGTAADNGTTYNLAAADDFIANVTAGDTSDATNAITVSNYASPTVTSATYDGSNGVLLVTGTGFSSKSGANNDVDVTTLTLLGEASGTRILTTGNVEVSSATQFSVTLNTGDKTAVDVLLNKAGTSSNDAVTYNLAAADNWLQAGAPSVDIADLTGNGITVSNPTDTIPPTISAVSIPNAGVKVGDAITVTITAGESGLSLNTGQVNGVNVTGFSDDGGGSYSATYTVAEGNTDRAAGDNIPVNFILTDAAGNTTTAFTTAIAQAADAIDANTATISSVSVPANATYTSGQNLDFTVNTSENVTVVTTGGTPQITITVGSTVRQAVYVSGSGSNALLFRYTVQAGDADTDGIAIGALSANGGTLRDAAGNNMTLTLNSVGSTAAVLVDAAGSIVTNVSSSTANGTYKSGDLIAVTVTFNENVTVTGTPQITLETGATDRAVNYTSGSGTATLTFNYTVQSGDVSADLDYVATNSLALNSGTIQDGSGNDATLTLPTPGAANSLGANKALVIDAVLPTVSSVSSSTTDGSYKAGDVIAVTVTFSENVTVTGTPQITLETGVTDRTVNYTSGSGTSTLTFNYTVQAGDVSADLDYVATNSLVLNSGTIKDTAGNDATLTLAAPGAANSLGANKAIVIDTAAPAFSAVSPGSSGSVTSTNVAYTLSEAIASGTVTFTRTGGTADANSPHVVSLAGAELNSGTRAAAALTNAPSLVSQATYTISFNATDAAGNTATAVSSTAVTFVDASVDALNEVQTAATNNDASGVTVAELNAITGVSGAIEANLSAYQAAIAAAAAGDVDNAVKIQALITSVNAIEGVKAAAVSGDASGVTFTELNSITGVSSAIVANEAAYQAAIAASTSADVDTAAKIEALIVSVNVVEAVKAAATANDAGTITFTQLNTILNANNVALMGNEIAYQTAIAALTAADVATAAQIIALVTQVNAIEVVKAYADNSTNPAPTEDDYFDVGIVGVTSGNLAEANQIIDGLASADVDTPEKIATAIASVLLDTDEDSVGDEIDADDDNDGIQDSFEAVASVKSTGSLALQGKAQVAATTEVDTDGDGIPDTRDADSDNDGIPDAIEYLGVSAADVDGNGKADAFVDANGDGLSDVASGQVPVDTDGDGLPDYRDTDSDGDGKSDLLETAGSVLAALLDADGDGVIDNTTDADKDGQPDVVDPENTKAAAGNKLTPLDTDGDGISDHLDTDSDNDGTPDATDQRTSTSPDAPSSGSGVSANGVWVLCGLLGLSLLRIRRRAVLLLGLLLSGIVGAADLPIELEIGLGQSHFDPALEAPFSSTDDVDPSYALGLGYRLHDNWLAQLRYTELGRVEIGAAHIDYEAISLNIQGELRLSENGNVRLFGLLGVANLNQKAEGLSIEEENTTEAHIAGGIKIYSEEMHWGFEVGSYNEDIGQWLFVGGVSF